MYLTSSELHTLRAVLGLLAENCNESEIRQRLGFALLDLLRADQFASFVWDAEAGRFDASVAINMDPSNLVRYDEWYQHHDPITYALQSRRHATRVTEVMPQRELMRTEFFNDFLARDGLHWGMNLHAFVGNRALGDLRIWRRSGRGDFGENEKAVLDLLEPAFIGALQRAQCAAPDVKTLLSKAAWHTLSLREMEVARAVSEGLTDKQIARRMAVGVPTVRTYLQRIFEKLGIERRSALASWAMR